MKIGEYIQTLLYFGIEDQKPGRSGNIYRHYCTLGSGTESREDRGINTDTTVLWDRGIHTDTTVLWDRGPKVGNIGEYI